MFIKVRSDGTIEQQVPSQVTQGSINANSILVEAPFPNTVATFVFELPTGEIISEQLAAPKSVDDNNVMGYWNLYLSGSITRYSGDVRYTVRFTDQQNHTLATVQSSISVSASVVSAPELDDIEQATLLEEIKALLADVLVGSSTDVPDKDGTIWQRILWLEQNVGGGSGGSGFITLTQLSQILTEYVTREDVENGDDAVSVSIRLGLSSDTASSASGASAYSKINWCISRINSLLGNVDSLRLDVSDLKERVTNIEGGSINIKVDDSISPESENPVSSAAIYGYVQSENQNFAQYWRDQNSKSLFRLAVGPTAEYTEEENLVYIPSDDASLERLDKQVQSIEARVKGIEDSTYAETTEILSRGTTGIIYSRGSIIPVAIKTSGSIYIGETAMHGSFFEYPMSEVPSIIYFMNTDNNNLIPDNEENRIYVGGTWICLGAVSKMELFGVDAYVTLWQCIEEGER